jgi:hypothetical protein
VIRREFPGCGAGVDDPDQVILSQNLVEIIGCIEKGAVTVMSDRLDVATN